MLTLNELTKDISKLNKEDICSFWNWLISEQRNILLISCIGDMFMEGLNGEVNWLDTGTGQLRRVADSKEEFQELLNDPDNIENWFLSPIVEELIDSGLLIQEQEVYSYVTLPLLGGQYSADNFKPIDISVHFAITGQICEMVKDLPDGTNVSFNITE